MVMHSLFLKPLFILAIGVGTLLTAVAMFTPGWRRFYASQGNLSVVDVGIITDSCGELDFKGDLPSSCGEWFTSQPRWEKAVIVLLIMALALEMVILAWAFMSCFAFCLPSLFYPLPFLAAIVAGLLVVAVSVYGAHNGHSIVVPESAEHFNAQSNIGYSFWVGVAASAAMIVATFIGCATAAATGAEHD